MNDRDFPEGVPGAVFEVALNQLQRAPKQTAPFSGKAGFVAIVVSAGDGLAVFELVESKLCFGAAGRVGFLAFPAKRIRDFAARDRSQPASKCAVRSVVAKAFDVGGDGLKHFLRDVRQVLFGQTVLPTPVTDQRAVKFDESCPGFVVGIPHAHQQTA